MRPRGTAWLEAASLVAIGLAAGAASAAGTEDALQLVGDAIPRPLTDSPGDPARGREIAFSRARGNCPICHVLPADDEALHGNIGPSLKGVADRLSEGQMRLRLADGRRINPRSIMPSYYRRDGLTRVQAAYADKTVLAAQEIEDVVAYLLTLRSAEKR